MSHLYLYTEVEKSMTSPHASSEVGCEEKGQKLLVTPGVSARLLSGYSSISLSAHQAKGPPSAPNSMDSIRGRQGRSSPVSGATMSEYETGSSKP